jgi:hypothetical protein
MDKQWMVYDTASGDIVFHNSEEEAQKDYDNAIKGIEEDELLGVHGVYIFKVAKQTTFVFYPED